MATAATARLAPFSNGRRLLPPDPSPTLLLRCGVEFIILWLEREISALIQQGIGLKYAAPRTASSYSRWYYTTF
jgi:hypothetical protein